MKDYSVATWLMFTYLDKAFKKRCRAAAPAFCCCDVSGGYRALCVVSRTDWKRQLAPRARAYRPVCPLDFWTPSILILRTGDDDGEAQFQ